MTAPLSSAPSTPYDVSTPGSASGGTPSPSDADIRTDPATTQPVPALTTTLTTPFRRFLGSPQDARSTPGVGRLRDYEFPVYDSESRRWFLLRVTNVNEAKAGEIDAGDFGAFEGLYGILGEAVDAPFVEKAPSPPPVEGGEGGDAAETATADGSTTITGKTTAVTISLTTSTITATSSFPEEDVTPGTYYAPLEAYNLPPPPKKSAPADDTQDEAPKEKEKQQSPANTVSRYGLLELTRLAPHADLVAPVWNTDERLVFKHYDSAAGLDEVWNAVQFPLHLAQSGSSSNGIVMPIKNLVTHERTRDDRSGRVVGFTVPYYSGGSLADKRRRGELYKLEWTRGLLEVVDAVNLGAGVVHGRVRSGRVFVDEKERVVLGGWGQARKRQGGKKGELEAGLEEFNDLYQDDDGDEGAAGGKKLETDVVAAVLLVHEMVTRDPEDDKWMFKQEYLFSGTGLDAILKGPWKAHPMAVLDVGAEEYRTAVAEWLDKREKDPRVKGEGKDLGFEEKMPVPEAETADVEEYEDPLRGDKVTRAAVSGRRFYRRDAVRHGKPVVGWSRPVAGKVDKGKRLLVTGNYARTEDEKKKNDLKRRRDGEDRGRGSKRGSKRARGGGRDSSRGDRGDWADRPRHGYRDGERGGRGRRDDTFGNNRVTRPGDGDWQRGRDGSRAPSRGRRPGRGGRGGGDWGHEGRSREGTGDRSASNDSRRRGGRRQDGGDGHRADGKGHGQGDGKPPAKAWGSGEASGGV